MSDSDELNALRRLAELEAKSSGTLRPLEKQNISLEAGINAAEGSSIPEAIAVGAGRFADKIKSGMKQGVMGAVELAAPGSMRDRLKAQRIEQADNDTAFKGMQKEHSFATAVGESLPYAAVPMSLGPVATGLTVGALEGSQYGNASERATKAVLGGVTGGIGAKISRALGSYVNPDLSKTQQSALQGGNELGLKARLSQLLQSPILGRFEDMASRVPGGAGVMEDFARANTKAMNTTAARSMGQVADEIGPETFLKAKTTLGKVFEDIKSLGKVNVGGRSVFPIEIDKGVSQAADEVLKTQAKLGTRGNAQVNDLAGRAQRLASLKGRIDGETYQLLRSDLSDASYTAFQGGDSVTGKAYQKLLDSLDNAADKSLRRIGQGDLADSLQLVRPQYANYKTLTKGLVAEGGDVQPGRLAQAVRTKNPDGFRTGQGGDLETIGRFHESFPPLKQGSQTFERQVASDPLTIALLGGPAFGIAKAATSPVMTAIPRVLAGTTKGKLAEALLDPATRAAIMGYGHSALLPRVPVLTEN